MLEDFQQNKHIRRTAFLRNILAVILTRHCKEMFFVKDNGDSYYAAHAFIQYYL